MLRDPVWTLPGISSSGRRPERNQLEYTVEDEKTLRAIEKLLEELGVPRDAVLIRIGEPPELRAGRPRSSLPRGSYRHGDKLLVL